MTHQSFLRKKDKGAKKELISQEAEERHEDEQVEQRGEAELDVPPHLSLPASAAAQANRRLLSHKVYGSVRWGWGGAQDWAGGEGITFKLFTRDKKKHKGDTTSVIYKVPFRFSCVRKGRKRRTLKKKKKKTFFSSKKRAVLYSVAITAFLSLTLSHMHTHTHSHTQRQLHFSVVDQ